MKSNSKWVAKRRCESIGFETIVTTGLRGTHVLIQHYCSGSGIGGLVGSYGTTPLALTNRSLISCGCDAVSKVRGPEFAHYDLHVL